MPPPLRTPRIAPSQNPDHAALNAGAAPRRIGVPPPALPSHVRAPVVVELDSADLIDEDDVATAPVVEAKPAPHVVPRPSGIRLRDERTFGDNDGERSAHDAGSTMWSSNVSAARGGGEKPTAVYMLVNKRSSGPPPLPPEELKKRVPPLDPSDDVGGSPESRRGRRI